MDENTHVQVRMKDVLDSVDRVRDRIVLLEQALQIAVIFISSRECGCDYAQRMGRPLCARCSAQRGIHQKLEEAGVGVKERKE